MHSLRFTPPIIGSRRLKVEPEARLKPATDVPIPKLMHFDLPRTPTVEASYGHLERVLHLTLLQDLKSSTATELHRDVFAILAHEFTRQAEISRVNLDLRPARLVDSMGLNLLVAILKWARQRQATVTASVAKRGVYATLLAVGLERQIELHYQEEPPAPPAS